MATLRTQFVFYFVVVALLVQTVISCYGNTAYTIYVFSFVVVALLVQTLISDHFSILGINLL